MVDFASPLMLEGDIRGALGAFPPGREKCPEEWLLQNPGLVFNVLASFRDTGADILPAMTFGANILRLTDYNLAQEHDHFNARLVELARTAAPDTCIAGGMAPSGHLSEPYGPLPYTDLVDTFAQQSLALASAGAEVLLLEGMVSLFEARAAVMGARQARIPMIVGLRIVEDGKTPQGTDPLAAMICLQELGISAFGLSCADSPETLSTLIRRLAPYAKVPLMARPGMQGLAPEDVSRSFWELLAAGARIIGGGKGATPNHMQALRVLLNEFDREVFPPPPPNEDPAIRLSDGEHIYFLDDPVLSRPIASADDMSGEIMRQEGSGADVLLFHLRDIEDAYRLGQNFHLCKSAVCLLADNAEALEMGLLYYGGRAMVSQESQVEHFILRQLAEGYGAVLYPTL